MTITNTSFRDTAINHFDAARNAPAKRARYGKDAIMTDRPSRFLNPGERGMFTVGAGPMVKAMNDGMVRFYQGGVCAHEEPMTGAVAAWFNTRFAA